MLKKRIIPVLLLKNGRMVKGKKFSNFKDTGDPNTAVKIYSSQDADELMFLDINSSLLSTRQILLDTIRTAAKECNIPLSVGGGVKTTEDVREILLAGADKVVITSSIVNTPKVLEDVAKLFGSQCIVAGIDYKYNELKKYNEVWIDCGKKNTQIILDDYIKKIDNYGVGEILLNSIDRDGEMNGYDVRNIKGIAEQTSTPVIACGGAGNFNHILEIFKKTEVSAAACSSMFHFGDYNPIQIRTYLRNQNIEMRRVK
jgi:cyclase